MQRRLPLIFDGPSNLSDELPDSGSIVLSRRSHQEDIIPSPGLSKQSDPPEILHFSPAMADAPDGGLRGNEATVELTYVRAVKISLPIIIALLTDVILVRFGEDRFGVIVPGGRSWIISGAGARARLCCVRFVSRSSQSGSRRSLSGLFSTTASRGIHDHDHVHLHLQLLPFLGRS
jgi:hypothetical protein